MIEQHYACVGRHALLLNVLVELGCSTSIEDDMGQSCHDLGFEELKKEAEKLIRIEQEQQRRHHHRTIQHPQVETEISVESLKTMRQKYVDDWTNFTASPPNPMRIQDIPWPLGPDGNRFMLWTAHLEGLREEQKRWHPDKFKQRYGKYLAPEEAEEALKRVVECAQSANAELDAYQL